MAAVSNVTPMRAIPLRNPSLPELDPKQRESLAKAKKYAVQVSVRHVLEKQQIAAKAAMEGVAALQNPGAAGAGGNESMLLQKQQALVLMCRVYVGSIYYDSKEEVIRNSFSPFGPFKSINMSFDPVTGKHKGFAFIEYECPEAAQLALEQMGGVMLGGRSIKVGRPANMPQSHPVIDLLLEESKRHKRLYVASVHTDLTTDDLKSVFSAFGNIISCSLVPDNINGKHKGYGFIEYETLQSANDAVSSMNLFDLGGQFLRVGKAITPQGMALPAGSAFGGAVNHHMPNQPNYVPPNMPAMAVAMNAQSRFQAAPAAGIPPPGVVIPQTRFGAIPPPGVVVPQIGAGAIPPPRVVTPVLASAFPAQASSELPNTLSAQEDIKVSGAEGRHMIMNKLMRQEQHSCVMVLKNMVGHDEVDDDLEEEVSEECGNYGQVLRVVIYKERQSEADDAEVVVKIFVKFAHGDHCKKGVEGLNGRWFGGRKIEASPFNQDRFEAGDFSE